jgi:hypothetical protein
LVPKEEVKAAEAILEKIYGKVADIVGEIKGVEKDSHRVAMALTVADWIVDKCTANPAEEAQIMMLFLVRYLGRTLPRLGLFDKMIEMYVAGEGEEGEED